MSLLCLVNRFANDTAMREIHRVLVPLGTFAPIWNVFDKRVKWVNELNTVIEPYCPHDQPRRETELWRKSFTNNEHLFTAPTAQILDSVQQEGDEQLIINRIMSVSFMATLPKSEQDKVSAQVHELLTTSPEISSQTVYTLPYRTEMYFSQKIVPELEVSKDV